MEVTGGVTAEWMEYYNNMDIRGPMVMKPLYLYIIYTLAVASWCKIMPGSAVQRVKRLILARLETM